MQLRHDSVSLIPELLGQILLSKTQACPDGFGFLKRPPKLCLRKRIWWTGVVLKLLADSAVFVEVLWCKAPLRTFKIGGDTLVSSVNERVEKPSR